MTASGNKWQIRVNKVASMFSKMVSGVATILYASGILTNLGNTTENNHTISSSPSNSIHTNFPCDWYRVEYGNSTNTNCDAFSMRHGMSQQSILTFQQKAEQCILKYGVSCVLSHEVGIDTPGYFYSGPSGTELVMLPQLKPIPLNTWKHLVQPSGETAAQDVEEGRLQVLLVDPDDPHSTNGRTVLELYDKMEMNYLHATSHSSVSRTVEGKEAFCAQLLSRSVPEECAILS